MSSEAIKEILEKIEPADDESMYMYNMLYDYLRTLSEDNGESDEVLIKMINAVDNRIYRTREILDEYEKMENVPEELSEMHDKLLKGFGSYFEGLLIFRNFLYGAGSAPDAFKYFHTGDLVIKGVEKAVNSQDEGSIFYSMG